LRAHVRCIWTYEAARPGDEPQPVPPDGCTELIVHLGRPYAELVGEDTLIQSPILFAGQLTKPLALRATGPVSVLGVRFEPDGARAFLGRSLGAATNLRLDLRIEHGADAVMLRRALRNARSRARRIRLVEAYVAARIAGCPVDSEVRAAVRGLEYELDAPVSALSERKLQRRFREHVGVSPRTLATIFRFRRLFNAIERPEHPGWLEAALSVGYFDQPHMARYFRRFLGCTASDWARRKAGLSTALARPVSESYKPPRAAVG
jgi:AraC-like DNA-binding protein